MPIIPTTLPLPPKSGIRKHELLPIYEALAIAPLNKPLRFDGLSYSNVCALRSTIQYRNKRGLWDRDECVEVHAVKTNHATYRIEVKRISK